MGEMAFVSAVPLLSSAHPKSAITGLPLTTAASSTTDSSPQPHCSKFSLTRMQVEFQTYSGGLDCLNLNPYSITRSLFKPSPSSLNNEDKEAVIKTALRHLFGNAYLMEEERAEFYKYESKFRCGEISAREFARAVAKSGTYRQRFFENVSQFRFIELNFKHFLGRAPLDQVEYSKHFKIFAAGGYEAEIDSYFNDPEYDQVFGDYTFPYTRFKGTYAPINQFNRMCTLEGGFAYSDKNRSAALITSLASNVPTTAFSVVDGLPSIPNSEHPSRKYVLPNASLEKYRNELEVGRARALQLELQLRQAYTKLDTYKAGFSTFTAMVSDMQVRQLPGPEFKGRVENYPTWGGAGMAPKPWGVSGVDTLSGVVRRPALQVSKMEKEYERIKQLVVDLERCVSVLEAQRNSVAITPEPMPFYLAGLPSMEVEEKTVANVIVDVVVQEKKELDIKFDPSTLITDDIDPEDDESQLVAPRPVEIETSRALKDVGRLPKVLMKEMEEKSKEEGSDFGGPKDGRLRFPGDGSEMNVG